MKNAKHLLGITILGITLLTATACKQEANKTETSGHEQDANVDAKTAVQAKPEFKTDSIATVFQDYLHLKDALVQTDHAEAKSGAKLLADDATDESVKRIATKISEQEDIKVQRELFSELTTALKPVLAAQITSGEIYEQHCPMALKAGANWLAVEQEINNPYYGDKMLRCGVVQETIK
ncbi:DUF3347 domain-containing protein [Formosa algae]|uniref:DUF3347 domain-containing protein n=1 Tax=Formosa algae TaxID=225843 RepID=A0A9X0YPJ5_9FLAO|nr:DUF3347 domain-containing protein [Formosa algae]MBP1841319.1 hypothetical protein [Formosa algae]MDQ0336759.1 hypothetical protein [Formosa algae]OEI78803.1 hypothetical protein AST99_17665 [Formosa algae]